MCQETVFGCVVLIIQGIENNEIRFWWAQLVKGTVVGDINAEQRDVEIVTVVIEKAHQQSCRSKSGTHFEIPFVHVGDKK